MKETIENYPNFYKEILVDSRDLGFDQLSNVREGSLLSTLCSSKPHGKFLELGTGTGLSTAWMLHGMCLNSTLATIDSSPELMEVAKKYLSYDRRVEFLLGDGESFISSMPKSSLDLIFADTWPGKYNCLEETLSLLKNGGIYMIDDMLPQDNWSEGHDDKVASLIDFLNNKSDMNTVKMCWSTGVIICAKNA